MNFAPLVEQAVIGETFGIALAAQGLPHGNRWRWQMPMAGYP